MYGDLDFGCSPVGYHLNTVTIAPQVEQTADGEWRLTKVGVRKRVTIAKELDREAKDMPKAGHADKKRMDDFDKGKSRVITVMEGMCRKGTKRTREAAASRGEQDGSSGF